jgi:hypothetical protein
MAEPDVIPTSASTASTGLGIRYVGKDFCYAYSGAIDVNNTETDLLNTTTQAGVIKGRIEFCYLGSNSQNMRFRVKLNDLVIWDFEADHSQLLARGQRGLLHIIIPPLTQLTCTGQNMTDTVALPLIVALSGRVYGAE